MGGTILGVSSQQPSTLITESWYTADTPQPIKDIVAYDHVLDKDCTLCAELGAVIAKGDDIKTPAARTPEQKEKQYPCGMTQPACFAVSASGEMLYKWVIQPDQMNGFGAMTRARPTDSWSIIKDRIAGNAPAGQEAQIDDQKYVMQAIADARSKAKTAKTSGAAKL